MKEFIKSMLSVDDNVSSKRVLGMLLILNYIGAFISSYFIELSIITINMANNMLMVGAGLLGLGILDKLTK